MCLVNGKGRFLTPRSSEIWAAIDPKLKTKKRTRRIRSLDNFYPQNSYPTKSKMAAAAILKITFLAITRPLFGALNLQGIEFARKGGGNCKEKNTQGKAPQFASVWICKEWIYPGNQEVESARNSICK